MREIKFRAWDKFNKKIYDVSYIGLKDSNLIVLEHTDEGTRTHRKPYPSACELIQYTGVRDENGVEIYECDKVSVSWIIGDKEYFEGIVKFKYGAWIVEDENGIYIKLDTFYINGGIDENCEVEVIGNIFEEA